LVFRLSRAVTRAPDPDDEDSHEGFEAGGESKAEDAGEKEPEAKRRQQFPASMGLSAFLPPSSTDDSDHVEVEVSWADYVPEETDRTRQRQEPAAGRRSTLPEARKSA
jgi:hypothetical protein